jgi:hypothetical protein
MGANVISVRLAGIAGIALFGLAACSKLGGFWQDEMGWARAALERNNRLEVVAADTEAKTFTLRVKDTGELRMVRLDQIVASPPGLSAPQVASNRNGAGIAAAEAAGSAGDPANAGGVDPGMTGSSGYPDGSSVPGVSGNAGMAGGTGGAGNAGAPAASGFARDGEPRAMIARAGEPAGAGAVKLAASSAVGGDAEHIMVNGVPDPSTGRVVRAGPGYSIKVESKSSSTAARTGEHEKPIASGALNGAGMERRHEPIVCKGDQMLHIDNRVLEFDGDAISAEDGCELHITNSRIVASGTGVAARGTANVHIANSQIEGGAASIDATGGGQIYAEASTFKGMTRRLDDSAVHDLGGNVWN